MTAVHRALAAFVALVGVLLAAPAPLYAAPTLRVGTYPNPPLIFRDEQGRPQGIYVDVLEHVARQEQWKLEYVEGAWEECLERLGRGERSTCSSPSATRPSAAGSSSSPTSCSSRTGDRCTHCRTQTSARCWT